MDHSKFLSSIDSLRVGVCDLNGTFRGKRIPTSSMDKALDGSIRMPISIVGVDIWGEDIRDDANVFKTGDIDGICEFTGRGPLPIDWVKTPTALIPLWLKEENGKELSTDPRRLLASIVKKYKAKGLTPVLATELEFYLFDAEKKWPRPPRSPNTGLRLHSDSILSLNELDDFDDFFNDVYKACEAYGIPADTAIAENGGGQFELNLLHVDCPMKAADDAIFFKQIVKGLARKHGLGASFMAKPYGHSSGSGFHIHFSLLDQDGNNVFDNGGDEGTETMLHAIAGLMDTMEESTLIFAPHFNSYRRLQPGSHAPTSIAWGYENRTAPIRIPGGSHKARRIEHRVAGADANPYLVIASVLGSALKGMEEKKMPSDPVQVDCYSLELSQLPSDWGYAIELLEQSEKLKAIFNPEIIEMFAGIKKQELKVFNSKVTNFEYQSYLETV